MPIYENNNINIFVFEITVCLSVTYNHYVKLHCHPYSAFMVTALTGTR